VSHPDEQDRPPSTPQEPWRGAGAPSGGSAGDYPYGPDAPSPRSPWPGDAAAQPGAAPQHGGGWDPPTETWRPQAQGPGGAPARYGADADWQQQDDARYGGGAPGGGSGLPTSTVVLLVVSGLGVFTGFATLAGVPALVLAVVAAASASTDRERAERLTRTGWIVFVAVIAASVLLLLLAGALFLGFFGWASSTGGF